MRRILMTNKQIVICRNRKECKGSRECVHSNPHHPINCIDPDNYCHEKKTYCSAIDRKTICIPYDQS